MKNINAAEGFLVFQKFFTDLLRMETEVVVWQVSTVDGQRKIHRSTLTSFKYDQGRLHFQSSDGGPFDFSGEVIFCWAEKDGVIFKSTAIPDTKSGLSLKVPDQLCFLEGPEIQAFKGATEHHIDTSAWAVKRLGQMERSDRDREIFEQGLREMALGDEEKFFEGKREAPRVRAKGDKKIVVLNHSRKSASNEHALYDLSRGGLAFVSTSETEYGKGEVVHVLEVDKNRLDSPLLGEVMSVRKIDDEAAWKVGLKFVDEL